MKAQRHTAEGGIVCGMWTVAVVLVFLGDSWGSSLENRYPTHEGREVEAGGTDESEPSRDDGRLPREATGISIGFDYGSAFVFRGLNVFRSGKQQDQHGVLLPFINWNIFETGLSLRLSGAYQTNGDNLGYNVDIGRGHRQLVDLRYDYAITGSFAVQASFSYYFYPFAEDTMTGVAVPSYLEPSIAASYMASGGYFVGLQVAYFAAVQERLERYRYLYLRPRAGKRFDFDKSVGAEVLVSFGYKLYNDRETMKDNRFDLEFRLNTPIDIAGHGVLVPGIGAAWTGLDREADGHSYVIWFNLGVELGL